MTTVPAGAEFCVHVLMSRTRNVPASVPSLRQISEPWVPSSAAK